MGHSTSNPEQVLDTMTGLTRHSGNRAGFWSGNRSKGPSRSATAVAPFQPLDPEIVNETIPAFFIGRNRQGFWVARDINGRIGGIFLFESSAVSFARAKSGPAGCATVYLSEPFELDLENRGNPLVAQLASLIRLARRSWARLAAIIGRPTAPVKRGMKDS